MFCAGCQNEVDRSLIRTSSSVECSFCHQEQSVQTNGNGWLFATRHNNPLPTSEVRCAYCVPLCQICANPHVKMNSRGQYLYVKGERTDKRRGRWLPDNDRIYVRCIFCGHWTGLQDLVIDSSGATTEGNACHRCQVGANIILEGWAEYMAEKRRIREELRKPV